MWTCSEDDLEDPAAETRALGFLAQIDVDGGRRAGGRRLARLEVGDDGQHRAMVVLSRWQLRLPQDAVLCALRPLLR
jgi:hypothetical protein